MKVLLVISGVRKSLQLEWTALYLQRAGADIALVLMGESDTPLQRVLQSNNIPTKVVSVKDKFDLLPAFFRICLELLRSRPKVVHTHLFEASFIGLIAGWLMRIDKRVYTRHHSAYHHHYHKNAVWKDKMLNWLATDIVAPCSRTAEVLTQWEKVSPEKVHLIPHGFELSYFLPTHPQRIAESVSKYATNKRKPVVGVIARYTEWKGIQFIIPAFSRLLKKYPDALLILANTRGDYRSQLTQMLKGLPDGSYREIEFEEDVISLYSLFDLYVHVPIDPYSEAFGQTYVEALAASVPSVFTLSGIACDFIVPDQNALVVPYADEFEIYQAMFRILEDRVLVENLVKNGLQSVRQFDVGEISRALYKLYA